MKARTKEYLSNGFGSIISNQRAIDAAKGFPWWVAIIIFLIGTFLPVIPLTVSVANSKGRSFVSTYNYSLDRDLAGISLDFKAKGYEFTVTNNMLTFNHPEVLETSFMIGNYTIGSEGKKQYSTVFYYNEYDFTKASTFFNEVASIKYIQETTTPDAGNEGDLLYIPNIVYLFKEGMAVLLTKYNTTTSAGSFSGDWVMVPEESKIIERVLNTTVPTPESKEKMGSAFVTESFENWKTIFDESYLNNKNRSLITTTFIYWGVYAGLTLFLGLLVFLLTRGKSNFNRYLKWYQCLLISAWASFAPGLLSMILGFFLTQYAVMLFIVFMGIRIMWMSMKQLSPTYKA